jgi:hypothetical protein
VTYTFPPYVFGGPIHGHDHMVSKTNGGSTARFYRVDLNDFYKKALGGNFTLNRFEGRR